MSDIVLREIDSDDQDMALSRAKRYIDEHLFDRRPGARNGVPFSSRKQTPKDMLVYHTESGNVIVTYLNIDWTKP